MKSVVGNLECVCLVFHFLRNNGCLRVKGGHSQHLLQPAVIVCYIRYLPNCRAVNLTLRLVSVVNSSACAYVCKYV
jgi:hypothetical protein